MSWWLVLPGIVLIGVLAKLNAWHRQHVATDEELDDEHLDRYGVHLETPEPEPVSRQSSEVQALQTSP